MKFEHLSFRHKVFFVNGLSLCALVVVGFLSLLFWYQHKELADQGLRSNQWIYEGQQILLNLSDMENHLHRFLLMEDRKILESFHSSQQTLENSIHNLIEMIHNHAQTHPGDRQWIDEIERLEEVHTLVVAWGQSATQFAENKALAGIDELAYQDYVERTLNQEEHWRLLNNVRSLIKSLTQQLYAEGHGDTAVLSERLSVLLEELQSEYLGIILTGRAEHAKRFTLVKEQFSQQLNAVLAVTLKHRDLSRAVNDAVLAKQLIMQWMNQYVEPSVSARLQYSETRVSYHALMDSLANGSGQSLMEDVKERLRLFLQDQVNASTQEYHGIRSVFSQASVMIFVVVACFFVVLAVMGFKVTQRVLQPLSNVSQSLRELVKGNHRTKCAIVQGQDDLSSMTVSVNQLALSLKTMDEQQEQQQRVHRGWLALAHALFKEQTASALYRELVQCITPYVNAQVGILYVLDKSSKHSLDAKEQPLITLPDESDVFVFKQSYGCSSEKLKKRQYRLDDRCMSSALETGRCVLFEKFDDDSFNIDVGLGVLNPEHVAILPLMYQSKPVGILVLGAINSISRANIDFLDQVNELIAFSLVANQSKLSRDVSFGIDQEKLETLEKVSQVLKRKNHLLEKQQKDLRMEKQSVDMDMKTLELQICQLQEQHQHLEQDLKTKSEFLATLCHEIRTPINGWMGITKLLAQADIPPRAQTFVDTLHHSGRYLKALLSDVVDLSDLEHHQFRLKNQNFDLEQIAYHVSQLMGLQAENKGLQFLFRYTPGAPRQFIGDGPRLQQILMNLSSNSVHFTSTGYVCLNVDVGRYCESEAAYQIKIQIKDTCVGMTDSHRHNLFKVLEQGDADMAQSLGGAGIGLMYAKRMLDQMKARVKVSTEPNAGTMLSLILYLKPDSSFAKPVQGQLKGIRCLLVDPLNMSQRITQSLLSAQGAEVVSVARVSEAIQHLKEANCSSNHFHCVLVDGMMPVLEQHQLSKFLDEEALSSSMPFIEMAPLESRSFFEYPV